MFESKWKILAWHLANWMYSLQMIFLLISFGWAMRTEPFGEELALHLIYAVGGTMGWVFMTSLYMKPKECLFMLNEHSAIVSAAKGAHLKIPHWASHPFVILTVCYFSFGLLGMWVILAAMFLWKPTSTSHMYGYLPLSWQKSYAVFAVALLHELSWTAWSRRMTTEDDVQLYRYLQFFCISFNDFNGSFFTVGFTMMIVVLPILFTYLALTATYLNLLVYCLISPMLFSRLAVMASISVLVSLLHISKILAKNHPSFQDALTVPRPFSHCRHVIHLPLNIQAENVDSLIQSYDAGITIIVGNSSLRIPRKLWDDRATCLVHAISSSIDSASGLLQTIAKFRQDDKSEYELFIALATRTEIKRIQNNLPSLLLYMQRGISIWLQQTTNNWEIDHKIRLNYQEMYQLQFYCNSAMRTCLSHVDLTSTLGAVPKKLNYFGWPLYIYKEKYFKQSYNFELIRNLAFWKLFTPVKVESNVNMPEAKLCFDIAKYLNATATRLVQEEDRMTKEHLSLIFPDTGLVALDRSSRPLMNSMQQIIFMYCSSRERIVSSGQLSIYLCPFDRVIWLSIILTLAGTALTLRISNEKSHILNLIRCLLLQAPKGSESLKKTTWVFLLWMFATVIITAFYTTFIESILVVPIKMSGPATFDQLYLANYTIVLPDSDAEAIDDAFRIDESPFSGTFYLDELRENAEYIPAPYGFLSPEFIKYAVNSEKRVLVFGEEDLDVLTYLVQLHAPGAECKVGRERITSLMMMWAGLGGHAASLRSILHQLFVAGMIQYMSDGSHRALTKLIALHAPSLSQNTRVNESCVVTDRFVMENAQFRMLFLSWLAGLGGSAAVFLFEIVASSRLRLISKKV